MRSLNNIINGAGKKIAKAGAVIALAAMPYISSAQHFGIPDSEWQNQRQHPNIGYTYFGKNILDYDGSGDANNDGIVDMKDAQAIRDGEGNYRADVARPFGIIDEADAQAIENYVNGTGKIIGKDFYETDKGITNEERIEYIMDKYNDVFMNMINSVPNSLGGKTILYPGFECYNYSEFAQNAFQGWADPVAFFEKYWFGIAKESIDTAYNYNHNGIFNLQCNTAGHKTDVGGAHSTIEFPLVGDLTKEENILRIDAQTGRKIDYGHKLLPFGEQVSTEWIGNSERWGPIRGPPIIQKIVYSDKTEEIKWENPEYNFYKDNSSGFEEIKDNNRMIDLDVFNNGYINIATKNPGETKVEVFSINGKLLENKVINTGYGDNMVDFNFEPDNNGVYIFVATDKNGHKDVVKIIK